MVRRWVAVAAALLVVVAGSGSAEASGSARWVLVPHGRFELAWSEGFDRPAPLGSFGDCDHAAGTPAAFCGRLPGAYRKSLWAYPAGWPDTAKSGQLGRFRVGGVYHPEDTVWVSKSAAGDGQLHVRMFRPRAGGDAHVAAVVPKAAMGMTFGRFVVRERVSRAGVGFKTADLRWPVVNEGCSEMDFPEASHHQGPSAFFHPSSCGAQLSFDSGVSWSAWHTYVVEASPVGTRFLVDGRVVGETSRVVGRPMDWVLQNETDLSGESAAPGAVDQVDVTSMSVYRYVR